MLFVTPRVLSERVFALFYPLMFLCQICVTIPKQVPPSLPLNHRLQSVPLPPDFYNSQVLVSDRHF